MTRLISVGPAAALAVAAIILLAAPGRACRGGLVQFGYDPNGALISGDNGTLSYDAGTHVFNASVLEPTNDPNFNSLQYTSAATSGNELIFVDPSPQTMSGTASLTLNLLVDNNGNFLANGTGVTFTGGLDFDGDGTDDASGTLLTGNIVAFGSQQSGPAPLTFNGLFDVTGGSLTKMIGLSGGGTLSSEIPVGTLAGFTLFTEQTQSGILGDFAASFSGNSVKPDAGPVTTPEPGGLILVLSGMAALCGFRLMRRRRLAGAH